MGPQDLLRFIFGLVLLVTCACMGFVAVDSGLRRFPIWLTIGSAITCVWSATGAVIQFLVAFGVMK